MGKRFRGEYSHSVDQKGRLIIPAKFRELLGDEFVVTKGFDGCLFVFDKEGWDEFEEKIRSLPMDQEESRALSRFFLAGAVDAETDKLGRINIPKNLLEYAHLEKEVIVAGVGNRAEIWDKARWDDQTTYDDINEIASRMSQYGLRI